MMTKKQIKAQIDSLRDDMRARERRYRRLLTDESYADLMLYKDKIDSWKRLYEVAPDEIYFRIQPDPHPFKPNKDKPLADIVSDASLPIGGVQ